ncbi:hypothetical protein CXF74_11380 [Psychromonas sp. Urea-02u-13]|nr:hypothetical protein CXF74_11380 [Psychromonas sp. Urea-02u-13]
MGGGDSGDSITIENAYTDGRYRIEEIVLADESVITGTAIFELPEYIAPIIDQVAKLVSVMSGFDVGESVATDPNNLVSAPYQEVIVSPEL